SGQDPVWKHQGPEHRLYRGLTAFGIDLKEVRVVGDEERAIVDALNALRNRRRDRASVRGTAPTRMWCCALVTHRNSRLPNARSRTCWSEHGEHNQIMSEPCPLPAKTGVRVPWGARAISNI